MIYVTLLKPCIETELAHLYEHLYVNALDNFFHQKGLLSFVDYYTRGLTFGYGLIYIEVTLYSPQAIAFESQLDDIDMELDLNNIGNCLSEIAAEYGFYISGKGTISDLIPSLQNLHAIPWAAIDDFTLLNGWEKRRSFKVLWKMSKPIRTSTLRCELVLENEYAKANRMLWPLFWLISRAFNCNLLHALAAMQKGYYFLESKSQFSNKTVKRTDYYRLLTANAKELDYELEACKEMILEAINRGIISQLTTDLRATDYRTRNDNPNEEELSKATRMFIGSAGWRAISTEENIRGLLAHTNLQLVYGKEKQSLNLASLLTTAVTPEHTTTHLLAGNPDTTTTSARN